MSLQGGENSNAPANKAPAYLQPGQTIGYNYEIIERIGEGGMAVVYKARQKSLNRFVAIKALHPRFARDESFVERFEAESGALASLSHANIVTIIDRGAEENVFFFVMEFVDGEDLDRKIIERKLTPTDWKHVIVSCRDALDYIHKRGVVHRDIKPSNILVSAEGQIKIGDFGIAHIVTGDVTGIQMNSGPIGTTYYISPEQANDPATVDPRADIYSLAVAFYKMMTRSMPEGDFSPPSELNQDVPVAVDEVIFRGMAFDREERHRNAKEFCDDLLRALSQQSLSLSAVFKMGSGPSSLYTGEDFRSKPAGNATEGKKTTSDSRNFGKGFLTSVGKTNTPLPTTSRAEQTKEKTPPPQKRDTTKTHAPAATPGKADGSKHSPVLIIVVGGIVILLIIGLLAGGYILLGKQASASDSSINDGPVVPLTNTRSPAQIREQQAEEIRLQRERDIILGLTPTPIATDGPYDYEDSP